jgi:HSP20 family protein
MRTPNDLARPNPYAAPAFFAAPLARWFDDVFDGDAAAGDRMLVPAIDVSENEHAFVVTTELPGLAKTDVQIAFENGVLSISGEKKQSDTKEGVNWHRVERRYGAFRRSVTLPRGAAGENAKATFADGLLTIEVPKREEIKPRTIQIS